jgi:ribokinase
MADASSRAQGDLVVFGEFFVDLVFYKLPGPPRMGEEVKTRHFAQFPGGGLATTALVATRLGTPTAVVTRVGTDAGSNPAWQKLIDSGICAKACEVSTSFPTAVTICAAYHRERMMITTDAINQGLYTLFMRTAVRRQVRRAKHLHLACALWPPRTWANAIRRLRSRGLTISTDIGWNPEVLRSRQLPALLQECEFTFPNELEARAMTGEKSMERAAKKLAQWVRVAVVKLGRNGCIAVQKGKVLRVKSIAVHTADATGAGDAFNGGFLHGYLSGWSIEDCLRAGNICGAMATTRPGGSSAIPSHRKLLQLMKRI